MSQCQKIFLQSKKDMNIQQLSDFKKKSASLNELFYAKNVERDVSQLISAIINGCDFVPIIQRYRSTFSKKAMKAIEEIVKSDIVKNMHQNAKKKMNSPSKSQIKSSEQQDKDQLQILFNKQLQLKADYSQLKKALHKNQDISLFLENYSKKLSNKQFNTLQKFLDSSQLNKWKESKKQSLRQQKVNQIFNHPDLKSDYSQLKKCLLEGKDISALMEFYEDELQKPELDVLNNIFLSKQYKILFPARKLKIEDQKQKKAKINQLFQQKGIKVDFSAISSGIIAGTDLKPILTQLSQDTSKKVMKKIRKLLNSNEIKQLMTPRQNKQIIIEDQNEILQKDNELSQLFIKSQQQKSNFQELKQKLIQGDNPSIEFSQSKSSKQQFTELKKIVNSVELKAQKSKKIQIEKQKTQLFKKDALTQDDTKLKKRILQNKDMSQLMAFYNKQLNPIDLQEKTIKINQIFNQKGLKVDTSEIVSAIISNEDTQPVLTQLSKKASKKQIKIIEEILNSVHVKELLTPKQANIKRQKLDQYFSNFQTDLTELKNALLKKIDLKNLLKNYEQTMSKREYNDLKNSLTSPHLKEILNQQKQLKQKNLVQYLSTKEIKFINTDDLLKKLLADQSVHDILKSYKGKLRGGEYKNLSQTLSTAEFQKIIKPEQKKYKNEAYQQKQKIETLLSNFKISYDLSELIEHLLKNESTEKLMQIYEQDMTGCQFDELQLFLSSNQLKQILEKVKKESNFQKLFQLFKKNLIKQDLSKYINAVLNHEDTLSIIQEYQDVFTGQVFDKFKKVIQTNEYFTILGVDKQQLKKDSKCLKLKNLFQNEKLEFEDEIIERLLTDQSVQATLQYYRLNLKGGAFKKIKKIVSSKQFFEIVESTSNQFLEYSIKNHNNLLKDYAQQAKVQLIPIQMKKMQVVNRIFKQSNISENIEEINKIKLVLIQFADPAKIMKVIKGQISSKQYQILLNLIQSAQLKIQLKKIQIQDWQIKHSGLSNLIKGIEFKKNQLINFLIFNINSQSLLDEIRKKESPQQINEFNLSLGTQQYHQFFIDHNLLQPIIIKKHPIYLKQAIYYVKENTLLSDIRQKYEIIDNYKFFNLLGQAIVVQLTLIEPLKLMKCTEFSAIYQGQNKNIFLPFNVTIANAKKILKKSLKTNLELIILVYKGDTFIEEAEDYLMELIGSKQIYISYYITLVITLNQQSKDKQCKVKSHKKVMEIKQQISTQLGIKKQAQRWYIDNKQVINNSQSLERLGMKNQYFRITIIEYKSLQYYGFTKQIQIKRHLFKDFFIEDDAVFCESIKNSKFPADQYSEIFRNQILGYIFAAIKKHSLIDSSLNHIKTLVESTEKQQDLWKPENSKQKCFFNEIFVLYYILRCSQKSLKIDILRGVIRNRPVPLTYHDHKGNYVELMEQNYWIQNKSFTIASFGLGNIEGKSQLLNLIFETSFKNKQKIHKQCQGGIEIQYDIYKSDEYSVNLIDISNDVEEQVRLSIAKASNLIIIHTIMSPVDANSWIQDKKIDVPTILIFRDVENAFEKQKRHYRAELKKNNQKNKKFNKFQIISNPATQIQYYNSQINEIANGIQQFVRKIFQITDPDNLWKFTDFIANRTSRQYEKFNNILKQIQSSKENLNKISNAFNDYKILQSDTETQNEAFNLRKMDQIRKKAVKEGLAQPLKRIISFYRKNFTLSSQIMCKIRIFLTLLKNELFRQFNRLGQLLKDAEKKKQQKEFQIAKKLIVEKLGVIKELKDTLTTPQVKNQAQLFIANAKKFKSSKDKTWELIIKKIKNQFQFQIQPKAFSVQNFWRQVIYLTKFDPNYSFKVEGEEIKLAEAIVNLGRKEVQDSQNFQVINGDLLQMPTDYLHKIFQHQQNKKVMVVAIFGPQSSGKSTLLNFVLGCDFMSSAGRCTKGIYGTYFEISNRQMPNCDAVLVLDTEGLFSNYQNHKFSNRSGFDNKLVLFCLQVCDIIILNTKGDVTKECQQILQTAYDSQILDANSLPELYFVLNLNGGEINPTQSNQIQKFCDTIIKSNLSAVKVVDKNHAAGMPMAFNQITRRSTAQFVTKYLKPKTLPSDRFYKETKNLCYNIMELISERGRQKEGRTLQQVFVKMDQTWSTINKYPILTKHGNKKIKILEQKINLWKKTTKETFLNFQKKLQQNLKSIKLAEIQMWSQQNIKILSQEIDKALLQFQKKFPQTHGQLEANTCIKKASIDIEPTLNSSIQVLKNLISVKKFQEQIRQSNKKGFDEINHILKQIKQFQAQSKQKKDLSQKQKIQKFEQCWKKREDEMKKKINRGILAGQSYQTTLQMYNGQLQLDKRTRKKIQIQANSVKKLYQIQIDIFQAKLREKFSQSLKNQNIFESSNIPPVMNIEEKQGDLKFTYLKMSKYFQKRSVPTFIKIDLEELLQALDYDLIKKQVQQNLTKQNCHNQFLNDLCHDFSLLGINLNKHRLRQVINHKVSNIIYKFINIITSFRNLSTYDFQMQYQFVINKEGYPKNDKWYFFYYFCTILIKDQKELNEYQLKKIIETFQSFRFLNSIPNFHQQFQLLILKENKTRNQEYSNKLIGLRLAQLAIKYYVQSFDSRSFDDKKGKIQNSILLKLTQDLKNINLQVSNKLLSQRSCSNFKFINLNYQFNDLDHFKTLLSKFSRYWKNTNLKNIFNYSKNQGIRTGREIIIGFFKRVQISVKQEYSDRPILNKYINKQYNEFLTEMKRSNFTEFIRQQLQYQSVFKDILNFIQKQKLEDRELNQAIEKIKIYTNEVIGSINNDLKQVSQIVRYDFIAELHFYSCHLLWKIREHHQWQKKQKIMDSFKNKKNQELKRFLNLASGEPYLENRSCAQKFIELYIQWINTIIKKDRIIRQTKMKQAFKHLYTREYVQIKIDEELNDPKLSQDIKQDKIQDYLLNPVDYFKDKYQEYYDLEVNKLTQYKYNQQIKIIKDMQQSIVQFRDQSKSEQLCITDQIFQGNISEIKEIHFIPLIVEALNKKYSPYVDSSNKIGLKIKVGQIFKVGKLMKEKQNKLFLDSLLKEQILITNLKIFLNNLADLLQELKNSTDKINPNYSQDQINQFRLSLSVSICSATCPCCMRNCDVDMGIDPNHTKHMCSYGHQMRAIKGMRIQSHQNGKQVFKASIQRCEDLENHSTFNFNGKDYTWQQFKLQRKNEWELIFKHKNKNQAQFAYYWKTVGKRICEYYQQKDNTPMEFIEYSRDNIKKLSKPSANPTNYIFALDESSSMSGNPWNQLVKAIRQNVSIISAMNKCQNQYLSIFKFNDSTTPVCQYTAPQIFNVAQIVFGSGGTSFTPAFKLGRQIVERHSNIDNVFILISDGEAQYPTSEIPKIQQLQAAAAAKGLRIEYVSILIGGGGSIMQKIKNDLKGQHKCVANAANVTKIFRQFLMEKKT